ncbi:MAG: MBL fold metallo-hydrolase [Acidimicrobiales bacterium]
MVEPVPPTTAGGRDEWLRPGAFEVAPGVHRLPLPLPNDGLRAVNVYALPQDGGVVLVDGGWAIPEGRAALASGLDALGHDVADIRQIYVTHIHRDHYSQALALRKEHGVRVALGRGERPSLEAMREADRRPLASQVAHLRAAGAGALVDHFTAATRDAGPGDPTWYEDPDDWLDEGTTHLGGRQVEVIATPGHTRGHVVYYDRVAGLLLAGDHVLPTITPSIGFEPTITPDPLGAFLRSLGTIRALPDATLLPAHGPVVPSVHRRIDELVEHHGRRLDQTEAAVGHGATTSYEVAGVLRWTRRERRFTELDLFNQMLAVIETDAHLRLLLAQGRLAREADDGGVRRFTVASAA